MCIFWGCCVRNHNAFEPVQGISSLNNGGGPHMAVSLSHTVCPSVHQQLYHQNTAVGWGGASLGVQQHNHMHPHQMEISPPNHILTMPLNQHFQQSGVSQNGDSVTVITGTNSILVGH